MTLIPHFEENQGETAIRILKQMSNINLSGLSQNEQLVLALWACSQSIKESARYLNLSERTIDYYRSRLRCRLNARTSNEMITKLIMMDDYEALVHMGKVFLVESKYFPRSKVYESGGFDETIMVS